MYSAFINHDIVVWNGVITRFGTIKQMISDDDEVRIANNQETEAYLKFN